MASNTAQQNLPLTSLDFDGIAANLKTFLSSYPNFQDYNFDDSNLSVMIDLLAYNTYLNAFYVNMLGSEMYLDTAQQRDSVVLRANELNYLPKSFSSSVANVNLTLVANNTNQLIITIPKGTSFTGKLGSNNYTFVTDENLSVTTVGNNTFYANNLLIYEGPYVTDTFTMDYSNPNNRFLISNPQIDINSLSVVSIENNGSNVITYSFTQTLLDLSSNSTVFFLQGAENSTYELYFGDNTVGRMPADGATIVAQYRVPSGELPNGINVFSVDGPISGIQNITLTVNSPASGGTISESIDSIKYYAPLSYSIQDRAITVSDYETLLKMNFPEITGISAYGGEDLTPPVYGKVFISVLINNTFGLPTSKQTEYLNFITPRSSIPITPVFVLPDYIYMQVNSIVKYNTNATTLSNNDISSIVTSAIQSFNTTNLNNFKSNFYYSQFVDAIDMADQSIVSNQTKTNIFKKIVPTLNQSQNISFSFNIPIDNTIPPIPSVHPISQEHAISSSKFTFDGKTVVLEDDSEGNIRLVTVQGDQHNALYNVGTIDYSTGTITLTNLIVNSYFGDSIRIYATPSALDYSSVQNQVLTVASDEISISAIGVKI